MNDCKPISFVVYSTDEVEPVPLYPLVVKEQTMLNAVPHDRTLRSHFARTARQLLLLAVCLVPIVLLAQNNLATLTGAITDASSASIPGATIEALNVATGVAYRGSTTEAGIYTIPLVPAGTYKITATKDGFQGAARENVEVRTGDRLQVDLKLEVGSSTQNVTVSAEAPLLETATASRGTVLSTQQVADLPINGRTVTLLSSLAPGVQLVNDQPSTQNRAFDGGLTDRLTINGGRSARNNYLLNGISNFGQDQSTGYANVNFQPAPDAVQEVRVQTNDYSAEFGHTSGGTINVNLKSGTNHFHGTGYYFLQNTVLRANTFTSNATGKPISPFQWKQPGLEVDGPVVIPHLYNGRNRTFFMFSWEQIRDNIPTPGNFRVPTLLERSGDFSQTFVNGTPITLYDPVTRVPIPGNNLVGRINPVAAAMLKYFPLPNIPVDSSGNNFYPGANAQTDTYNTFTYQIDQIIDDRNRITATFAKSNRSQRQADNGIAEEASTDYLHQRNNIVAGLAWTDVLTPTAVLNIRGGFSRHLFQIVPTATEFGASGLTGVGFPTSLVSQLPLAAFPNIAFCADSACSAVTGNGNYLAIGGSTAFSGGLVQNYSNNINLGGSLTKAIGRHSLKFGAEYDDTFNNRINQAVMTLAFSPVFTQQSPTVNSATQGNAFADFLLGFPGLPNGVATETSGTTTITPRVASNISPALENRYYATYVQDDWRVSSRLTLNLGLRWDLESPPTERYNRFNDGFNGAANYALGCLLY